MQQPRLAGGSTDDLQVEPVELFPHFGAALLAHLAHVFPRRRNAGHNRGWIGTIKRERVRESCRVYFCARRDRNLQGVEQAQPARRARVRRLVETQLEIYIYEARGMLGAL